MAGTEVPACTQLVPQSVRGGGRIRTREPGGPLPARLGGRGRLSSVVTSSRSRGPTPRAEVTCVTDAQRADPERADGGADGVVIEGGPWHPRAWGLHFGGWTFPADCVSGRGAGGKGPSESGRRVKLTRLPHGAGSPARSVLGSVGRYLSVSLRVNVAHSLRTRSLP